MKKIFIFHVEKLTTSFHSYGGAVVISSDLESAIKLLRDTQNEQGKKATN